MLLSLILWFIFSFLFFFVGKYPKMSHYAEKQCQIYFHTKRTGDSGMKALMNRTNDTNHTNTMSDCQFWELLGRSSFDVWLNTRRPITLHTASIAFKSVLTFQQGANGHNLLQAARVSISNGNMNNALQLCATIVLEFPGCPSDIMSEVVLLSSLVGLDCQFFSVCSVLYLIIIFFLKLQRHLKMDPDTIISYIISLIPLPPKGLTDDHILLQLARVHDQLGNKKDSKAAAFEIFSTLKRRRKLPRGVGTFKQWYTSSEMWLSFSYDYTKYGYDLAALDCSMEALRLSSAVRDGILLQTNHIDDDDDESNHNKRCNHDEVIKEYIPKEGITYEEAVQAATLIQARYRVRQGQLSYYLKMRAIASLSLELTTDVLYVRSLRKVAYIYS
jgi:hypothetical protein